MTPDLTNALGKIEAALKCLPSSTICTTCNGSGKVIDYRGRYDDSYKDCVECLSSGYKTSFVKKEALALCASIREAAKTDMTARKVLDLITEEPNEKRS